MEGGWKVKTNSQRGSVILAIIAIVAMAGIIYVGYKLIQRLQEWHPDGNHGQGTNAEPDITMVNTLSNLTASYGPLRVEIPEFKLTLPVEALEYGWYYTVQTSTNLLDWSGTDLEWEYALELARTNHTEPCRYWRRLLWW